MKNELPKSPPEPWDHEEEGPDVPQWSISLLYALSLAGFALSAAVMDITGTHSQTASLFFRAGLALLALAVVFRWGVTEKRFYAGWAWFVFLGIWVLLFIRLAFTAIGGELPNDYPLEHYVFFFVGVCLIPTLGFFVEPTPRTLESAQRASFFLVLPAVVITAIIGLLIAPMYLQDLRLTTPTLNPITIGHLGVTLFILGWWFPRSQGSTGWRRILEQVGTRIGALVGLAIVPLTVSRGPIVALGVVLLFTGLSSTSSLSKLKMIALLSLLVGFLGYSFVFLEENLGIAPMLRFGINRDSSVLGDLGERPTLLSDAWMEFLEDPITGSGIVERKVGTYPHNVLVEGFMSTGIVGGLLVAVVVAVGAISAWRLSRSHASARWLAQLTIQRIVGAMFSGGLYFASDFWTFVAASVCVEYALRRTAPNTSEAAYEE